MKRVVTHFAFRRTRVRDQIVWFGFYYEIQSCYSTHYRDHSGVLNFKPLWRADLWFTEQIPARTTDRKQAQDIVSKANAPPEPDAILKVLKGEIK
jgi:hypothetical protein